MKLTKINDVTDFLATCNKCEGEVILESIHGDRYNLKSALSQYIAIGALLGNHGDELELFCYNPSDEHYFYEFFDNHPGVIAINRVKEKKEDV